MDRTGWSKVSAGSVMFALGASQLEHLHQVSSAYYYTVEPRTLARDDLHVNWGTALHDGDWAVCPEGTYVRGLFRSGSKFDGNSGETGGWQIEKAMCSRFAGVERWGKCFEVETFDNAG